MGLYINATGRHQQTIAKGKSVVYSHYLIMKNKKMTHNYAKYKIVIPKLESFNNYKQCQTLLAPLKKTFQITITSPNQYSGQHYF